MEGAVDEDRDLEVDTLTNGQPVELIPRHSSNVVHLSFGSTSAWLTSLGKIAGSFFQYSCKNKQSVFLICAIFDFDIL